MKSLMFVPGRPKMLAKIPAAEADACIIDLEDSVNDSDKEKALNDTCRFLSEHNDKKIFVRIAEGYMKDQLAELSKYDVFGYMIPKFEKPEAYADLMHFFINKEIIALVETPFGIANIREIAETPMATMIAFGAEDFTSIAGMKNCEQTLNYARSTIVTHGKAFKKKVIDTPSLVINDQTILDAEIQLAVDMGFDGKLAIHPKQVQRINEIFGHFDIENIKKVVELYESKGDAVLRIEDRIYEKMHIEHFRRILKEHA